VDAARPWCVCPLCVEEPVAQISGQRFDGLEIAPPPFRWLQLDRADVLDRLAQEAAARL
jgi:hypothetical protein